MDNDKKDVKNLLSLLDGKLIEEMKIERDFIRSQI